MKISRTFQCKKILLTSIVVMLLASVTMVTVASASPETKIYMDPAVITEPQFIKIMVDDAPDTFAWEFRLRWDPDLLELVLLPEGDFLWRGTYETEMKYAPNFIDANVQGEILVGCTLEQEEGQPPVPWASGDGELCSVGFLVDAGATGSCLINLLDTKLFDHIEVGSPAPTMYPNKDCFFYNVEPSHDIKVTDIKAPSLLTMGDTANVNVTVLNEGTVTETFNLTVYASGTPIGTTTIVDLPGGPGNSEDLSFTFEVPIDTTVAGTVTLSATAVLATDNDPNDNSLTDGTVKTVRPDLWVQYVASSVPEVKIGGMPNIIVQVMNLGPTPRNFDIVIYANSTPVITYSAIYKKYAYLIGGGSALFIVPWPTVIPGIYMAAEGTYTISALVPPVAYETNLGPPLVPPPYTGLWTNGTYYDNDGTESVTVGDLRLTPVRVGGTTYPPMSPVLPGHLDIGIPLMIYGRNRLTDGKVIVTYADAKLIDWKLKVNGKSGTGIGHRSTVNATNTLEARVGNATRNVLVRVMFEIKDAVGTVIAKVYSNTAFLPVGETTILTGSWTAKHPGIFHITAYLNYGTAYPIISGGFSQTLTLRVDAKPQG